MLYRIEPNGRLTWTPLFQEQDFELFDQQQFNLDRIDWKPVTEHHDVALVVQVALRYGVKTPSGIAVCARHVSAIERPDKLREEHTALERASGHPHIVQMDQLIEEGAPGWIDMVERGKDQIRKSTEQSIREANAKAKAEMKVPVKTELVAWWRSLGGDI